MRYVTVYIQFLIRFWSLCNIYKNFILSHSLLNAIILSREITMGASSGGKKKYITFRNRQRANLSFFIVVMFFAVFGIIVFTEIFFIDERSQTTGGGVYVKHGPLTYQHKDKGQDYDDGFQVRNFLSIL